MAAGAANKGIIVCFSINNRSLITPPTIACTRSKLSYFSVMIWALSLHKYEYEYWVLVQRSGLLWEEAVFISACLSWGVNDKLHLQQPRAHAGTQTLESGDTVIVVRLDIMMYVGHRDLVDIGKRALHLQISINNQNLPPARFVRFWQENWFIASAFLLRHMNLCRSMLPDISCTLYLQ